MSLKAKSPLWVFQKPSTHSKNTYGFNSSTPKCARNRDSTEKMLNGLRESMGTLGGRPWLGEGSDGGGGACSFALSSWTARTARGKGEWLSSLPHFPWDPAGIYHPGHQKISPEQNTGGKVTFERRNTNLARTHLGLSRNRWNPRHRPP